MERYRKYRFAAIYGIIVIIVFVFGAKFTVDKVTEFLDTRARLEQVTAQAADAERRLQILNDKLNKKKSSSGKVSKKIMKPSEQGIDENAALALIFDDILSLAKSSSVKIRGIDYIYNPKDDLFVKGASGSYAVCRLKLKVVSSYTALESFMKELYKYPYLIEITEFSVVPYENNKKILLTNLIVTTYSYK